MKKIFLMAAALCSLFMAGCIDKDNSEPEYISAGMVIYGVAQGQNAYALDLASVAFRLDILLETAAQQGVDVADLSTLEVTIGDKKVRLLDRLLNGASVTSEGQGIYTLAFHALDYSATDVARTDGRIVINTGGKFLSELTPGGEFWTVSIPESYPVVYTETDGYNTFTTTARGADSYTISCDMPGYWEVECTGYKSENTSVAVSDWNMSATVSTSGLTSFVYDEVAGSEFYLDVDARGKTMYSAYCKLQTEYSSMGMRYVPKCAYNAIVGGTEYAEFVGAEIEGWESYNMNVKWSGSASDCKATATVVYNGTEEVSNIVWKR